MGEGRSPRRGRLLAITKLVATPHTAALVPEVAAATEAMGIDNAVRLLRGEYPSTIVNPGPIPGRGRHL